MSSVCASTGTGSAPPPPPGELAAGDTVVGGGEDDEEGRPTKVRLPKRASHAHVGLAEADDPHAASSPRGIGRATRAGR